MRQHTKQPAALLGWIGLIEAATIHLGSDVLVFTNSGKLRKVRIKGIEVMPQI